VPAHQLPSAGPCFPPAPRSVSAIQLGTVKSAGTYVRSCACCVLHRHGVLLARLRKTILSPGKANMARVVPLP
jgi:hypothetical protein